MDGFDGPLETRVRPVGLWSPGQSAVLNPDYAHGPQAPTGVGGSPAAPGQSASGLPGGMGFVGHSQAAQAWGAPAWAQGWTQPPMLPAGSPTVQSTPVGPPTVGVNAGAWASDPNAPSTPNPFPVPVVGALPGGADPIGYNFPHQPNGWPYAPPVQGDPVDMIIRELGLDSVSFAPKPARALGDVLDGPVERCARLTQRVKNRRKKGRKVSPGLTKRQKKACAEAQGTPAGYSPPQVLQRFQDLIGPQANAAELDGAAEDLEEEEERLPPQTHSAKPWGWMLAGGVSLAVGTLFYMAIVPPKPPKKTRTDSPTEEQS